MRISGFTFLRNAHMLGYPFVESIRSILPLVDEFVIALGASQDDTEPMVRAIADPKIRILNTTWNENIRNDLKVKGFVYGQQKSIALFNCTGDWAFYLEGDEVLHEDDLPVIRRTMEQHLDNSRVEALTFNYLHIYGNRLTQACSPGWYRREARVLRNTIPAWGPKGLFFTVLDNPKQGRYPRAAPCNARIFHYGWVRSQSQLDEKCRQVIKYWRNDSASPDLREIDPQVLVPYTGPHPSVMRNWLPPATEPYAANPHHVLTPRERKHRWMMHLEKWFGLDLAKKHYTKAE